MSEDLEETASTVDKDDSQNSSERTDDNPRPNSSLEMPEDSEGMASPPKDASQSKATRPPSPWVRRELKSRRIIEKPPRHRVHRKSEKPSSQKTKRKSSPSPTTTKHKASTKAEKDDEDSATTEVKQFSFPQFKILSGASVAPVKMYPQKVVVQPATEWRDEEPTHWAQGLFQPTKMSLRLRLLRLLLVWVFFRVLNKQTAWLSDKLGIGLEDEPAGPPHPRQPGERYIRVFHEDSPHPIHVRVRPPPNPGPGPSTYSRGY